MAVRPSPSTFVNAALLAALALVPTAAEYWGAIFYQDLATRLIILAIAAASLNFILGYGGMISFGHAAYLGIGAYCVGIPVYYEIYSGWVHFPLAIGCAAAFALLTGLVCLRTQGVYFIMITMAFAQMLFFALVSIEEYGGDDGLVIELRSEFSGLFDLENAATLYYCCFAALLCCLYLFHRLVDSRFGRVMEASRSNPARLQALGFHGYRYRLVAYVIAGAVCGFAGALLGNFTNFISPDMMDWTRSGELIFIVVLGGVATRFGPLLGAAVFIVLEEVLSTQTVYWQLPFGLFLIAVVLFARGGLGGLLGARR